jgi:hypothetical protein
MNFRPNILRNPLSDLFGGGGGSQSTASTTNQQVGAEANSGPVFGAISTKGGAIKQTQSNKTTRAETKAANQAARSAKNNPSSATAPETMTATAAPSVDMSQSATGPSTSDAGGGSGNVNISVVSGDSVAEQHTTDIATTSITNSNTLAGASIDAQNKLALAALGTASNISALSFGLAAQSSAQSAQNSSDVAQAGQNLAAIGIGTQAAEDLISPTGGEAVQQPNYSKLILALSVAGFLVTLFKE